MLEDVSIVVVVVVDDVFLLSTFVVSMRCFFFLDIAAKASSSLSDELSPPKPLRGLPRLTTMFGAANKVNGSSSTMNLARAALAAVLRFIAKSHTEILLSSLSAVCLVVEVPEQCSEI